MSCSLSVRNRNFVLEMKPILSLIITVTLGGIPSEDYGTVADYTVSSYAS